MMAGTGEHPLLLMDDLASEFDRKHLRRVLDYGVQLGSQLWVTGTSLEPYSGLVGEPGTVFHVEHGNLSRKSGG